MLSMRDELDDLYSAVGNLALDFHRYRSLEQAIEAERDETTWLNETQRSAALERHRGRAAPAWRQRPPS